MTNVPIVCYRRRALINQAVADAAAHGKQDIRALYFVTYLAEDVTPEMIRAAIDTLRQATPAAKTTLAQYHRQIGSISFTEDSE